MGRIKCLVIFASLCSALMAQEIKLYPDQGFEGNMGKLGIWPESTRSTLHGDTAVFYGGKQSLRVDSGGLDCRMFALMNTRPDANTIPPKTVVRVSCKLRCTDEVERKNLSMSINLREIVKEPKTFSEIRHKLVPAMQKHKPLRDGWEEWSGYITHPGGDFNWQFLFGVEYTGGSVWFDDLRFEMITDDIRNNDVFTNWIMGVEIGAPPLRRFIQIKKTKPELCNYARRYNALLWKQARNEAALLDVARAAVYLGKKAVFVNSEITAAEESLQKAYLAFNAAFKAGGKGDWTAFEKAAADAEKGLASSDKLIADFWRGIPKAGLPPHYGRQSRDIKAIEPNGKMNRLLIGVWSPTEFLEEEKPFDFEFHSAAPGTPRVHTEESMDFSNITDFCRRNEKRGFRGTFSYLDFGTHDQDYAPKWFIEKNAADDDFFRTSSDGAKANNRKTTYSLNFFNPTVRKYYEDYLSAYSAYTAKEPHVLFHEVFAEALMNFSTENGPRSIGYGPSATAAFRAYLRSRYAAIGDLNKALGTKYASFDDVVQPEDPLIKKPGTITPLFAEFANFHYNSYMDYLALLYKSLKKGDPNKPVVARFSGLISEMNGARAFEVCDVVSHHCRAPRMQLAYTYLNSINRYYGNRGLGYMEDFWGCQDAATSVEDERIQRRGLEKHIARTFAWGRFLQMKWYSYTAGPYIFTYNGNWMSLEHDLTTMRYCAPALGNMLRKMEKFDWILTHSSITPSKLLVLQPSASMRNFRPDLKAYSAMQAFHNMSEKEGLLYEVLPEEIVEDGRADLNGFHTVALPSAPHLSANLQQKLLSFVKNGGNLIALGELPVCDELARKCDILTGPLSFSDGDGVVYAKEARLGKGFVRIANADWMKKNGLLKSISDKLPRTAWADGDIIEVIPRVDQDGNEYLFLINPSLEKNAKAAIHFTSSCKSVIDISLHEGVAIPAQNQTFAVTLAPAESAVVWLKK